MTKPVTKLTLQEAADESGINEGTIRHAVLSGRIPASKVPGYNGGGPKYLIDRRDLAVFQKVHSPKPRQPWTDADDSALAELIDSCTTKQLASYLNRSESAITQHLWKLKLTRSVNKTRIPFFVPYNGILVAKTCITCGALRDATYFRVMRKTDRPNFRAYDPVCYLCNIRNGKKRYAVARERDPELNTNTGRLHNALQAATKDYANRDNHPYTLQEIDVILDRDKSTLQVALELGRTFYAIRLQRFIHGINDQTYSDIFPNRKKKRRSVPDTYWLIHFPNALKALQEHFRSIGDDSLWDLPHAEIANQHHRRTG